MEESELGQLCFLCPSIKQTVIYFQVHCRVDTVQAHPLHRYQVYLPEQLVGCPPLTHRHFIEFAQDCICRRQAFHTSPPLRRSMAAAFGERSCAVAHATTLAFFSGWSPT